MEKNMETKVVNCKVKYIRPLGYNNLKEWCDDENNIYIGRKGIVFVDSARIDKDGKKIKERYPKYNSLFANPFKVKKNKDGRNEVVGNYEEYIIKKIENENLYDELLSLEGKNLGCWCKESNRHVGCHGDVLLKLLKNYKENGKLE
tara:strand:+ start:57 stop:494 length:438 start_codon:yes stop_codon:yes gene_type:complete